MSYVVSGAMPQVAAMRAARRMMTSFRSAPACIDSHCIRLASVPLSFSASFSSSAAVHPSIPPTPTSSYTPSSRSPASPSSSSTSTPLPLPSTPSTGVLGSIASFILPLFRPFRHALGLDSLAVSDALYRRAVASSTPALLSSYSFTASPLTGLSPLTTLHLFLTHSALSRLSLADPVSPYPGLLRATLEAWWVDLSAPIIQAIGALRAGAALREEQQRLMGLFRALDLALKVEGEPGQALVRSVLHHNLYGRVGEGKGREAEVVALEGWLRRNWERTQTVDGSQEELEGVMKGALPFQLEALPAFDEKQRAALQEGVRLVNHRVEVVNGVERIVEVSATQEPQSVSS